MAENADTINDNAQAPRRVTGDSGSVEQHSIPDQIAADKYAASKRASSRGMGGIRFTKLIPPGHTD